MSRFEIKDKEELDGYEDPHDLVWDDEPWGGYGGTYLVDTKTKTILFTDQCEPEDASLTRHFYTLVELLNQISHDS